MKYERVRGTYLHQYYLSFLVAKMSTYLLSPFPSKHLKLQRKNIFKICRLFSSKFYWQFYWPPQRSSLKFWMDLTKLVLMPIYLTSLPNIAAFLVKTFKIMERDRWVVKGYFTSSPQTCKFQSYRLFKV